MGDALDRDADVARVEAGTMTAPLIVPVVVVLAWFARKDPLHSWSVDDYGDGTE